MKTASVAELKARLSEYIAAARAGDDVIVTDRGRPVARLTGLADLAESARVAELIRTGTLRPARRVLNAGRFSDSGRVADPEGRLLAALLQERDEGR